MLRVLIGAAWLDKSLVQTEAGRRKVVSEFYYASKVTNLGGPVYDISDLPPERSYADDAAIFGQAEQLALAMFEDIFFGGGCGEEGCCGPSGIWHEPHSQVRGKVPAFMTFGERQLRLNLKRPKS
ncbi:hypothetical protein ABVT35_00605 [Hoeflea sp. TYP-13]